MTRRDETPTGDQARTHAGADRVHVHYQGLSRPAVLEQPEIAVPALAAVIRDWPATITAGAASGADPFVTLRPVTDTAWHLDAHLGAGLKTFDPVNAMCDFVAELSWERLRSRPELLCLHAAAVQFGDTLVLFPSGRRSGKSTLSAALARRGRRLFSDDFVPVEIDRAGRTMRGLANGIAPRLRLPLPDESSNDFRAWVAADPGPANRQYKYLAGPLLATANEAMPLGAVVVLDRQEGAAVPRLVPIAPEEALSRLILQNFARTAHAGGILKAIHALVAGLATFRLSYGAFEEAAAYLDTCAELQSLSPARLTGDLPDGTQAILPAELRLQPTAFDPATAYVQSAGFTETALAEDSFLADGTGTAIHRLNRGSTVVWRLLEEPMRLDDIAAVIAEAFAGTEPAQIRADAERTLRDFLAARLIQPVSG